VDRSGNRDDHTRLYEVGVDHNQTRSVRRDMLRGDRTHGQALVEFSLAIIVFLVLLMAVVDFGMAIYKYNGVSQAAREIARVASVHQGPVTFGNSAEITAVVATQKKLIPGLTVSTPACTKIDGSPQALSDGKCPTTAFVTVTVNSPYKAATPLLGLVGTWDMKGSSSAQIQQ
jgi:Flp pilus assembly protein TadG